MAHERAKAVLTGERKALDALAEELVAKEMVTARRLDEILNEAGAQLPPAGPGPGAPPHVDLVPPAIKPPVAAADGVRPSRSSRGRRDPEAGS
jgi:hypothetical protein